MNATEQIFDNPKKDDALRALLDSPTITEAAEVANIGRTTLHKWLKDPEFSQRYRQMRREALDHALAKLQRNANRAADVLREVMDDIDAPPASRIAAADKTLQHANAFSDLDEIDELIEHLRGEYDDDRT